MRLTNDAQVIGGWVWEHFKRCAERATQEVFKRDAVVTSGYNGTHSEKSLHYSGEAWDLRVWVDMFDPEKGRHSIKKCEEYADRLRFILGDAYDVVVHYDEKRTIVTHIHVEFDLY